MLFYYYTYVLCILTILDLFSFALFLSMYLLNDLRSMFSISIIRFYFAFIVIFVVGRSYLVCNMDQIHEFFFVRCSIFAIHIEIKQHIIIHNEAYKHLMILEYERVYRYDDYINKKKNFLSNVSANHIFSSQLECCQLVVNFHFWFFEHMIDIFWFFTSVIEWFDIDSWSEFRVWIKFAPLQKWLKPSLK